MGYFEIKKSDKETKEPYYFVLKAANHEVIARSEMYTTKAADAKRHCLRAEKRGHHRRTR
jgi:Domain of unknown function (DUF1508).